MLIYMSEVMQSITIGNMKIYYSLGVLKKIGERDECKEKKNKFIFICTVFDAVGILCLLSE